MFLSPSKDLPLESPPVPPINDIPILLPPTSSKASP
jgi:hypothetical protein